MHLKTGIKKNRIIINSFMILCTTILLSCDSTNLSPARDIIGTWKATASTEFSITANLCGDGSVATQDRVITMVITKGADDNHVNIRYSYTSGSLTKPSSCLYTGIIPEVQPQYFTGVINGVYLTIDGVASFSFTTSNMMGTWDSSSGEAYVTRTWTATNGIKLYKQ